MSVEEVAIQVLLSEARALNKLRAQRRGYDPIPIVARAYYTDALISVDAFAIAGLLDEQTPYKRWVEHQTGLNGTKLVRCYEKRWSIGLVGMEITPIYLGGYMPEIEVNRKVEQYNRFLEGEIDARQPFA